VLEARSVYDDHVRIASPCQPERLARADGEDVYADTTSPREGWEQRFEQLGIDDACGRGKDEPAIARSSSLRRPHGYYTGRQHRDGGYDVKTSHG
jgi:hypothetical protein